MDASGQQHVESVDAVVVGSGFGGSVSAFRMAERGRSVVVLERGRAWPPGSFARSPRAMARNFWDPSEGMQGLFDVWSFRGLEGLVSAGLGGGSLIYANVLLRKDEKWFVHDSPVPGGGYENWPVTRAQLDPHYAAVEDVLGATRYPYTDTPKTQAMEDAARALGMDIQRPPLAVSFATGPDAEPVRRAQLPTPEFGNVHGLPRLTCRLCGECDLGCNDGSKNTLDHTYLSRAAAAGADLRTRHEVRGFMPLEGGGYEVRYVVHDSEDDEPLDTSMLTVHRIRCRRLVLAAGTFGTTYLLLRNRTALPGLSTALGTRFTGNGDLLGFMVDATDPDGAPRRLDASTGPVITTAIRTPDHADDGRPDGPDGRGRGHYVEDAGYPGFTDWLVETAQLDRQIARVVRFAAHRIADRITDSSDSSIGADIGHLLGQGALSSSSLPLLGMGRDVPDGRMSLRDGRLAVEWFTATSREYFEGVRETMRKVSDHHGATFLDNPTWLAKRVITVHPLGGSPMGRDVGEGVCDEYGQVFGHPGLYVMDGSLLPGPVGANPSLTIAAVADRAVEHLLEEPVGEAVSLVTADVAASVPEDLRATGATSVSFTEQMKGFVSLGQTDPLEGRGRGRANDDRLMFELTITADDVDAFVADPMREGRAEGYVDSDVLGGRLDVERGWFNLFVHEADPASRTMRYRLWLRGPGGNAVTLTGHKDVHDDAGLDVWLDTSTLYVRILQGHVEPAGDDAAEVLAAGVITIHIPDFLWQLTTFRARGPQPVAGLAAFGRLFLGELWDVYGATIGAGQPEGVSP